MNIFLSNADEKNSDTSNIESMNSQKIISLLDKTSPDENEQKNEQEKENENQNINQNNNDCGKKIIKLIFFLLLILINVFSYYYKANSHHNDWTKNKTDATDDDNVPQDVVTFNNDIDGVIDTYPDNYREIGNQEYLVFEVK